MSPGLAADEYLGLRSITSPYFGYASHCPFLVTEIHPGHKTQQTKYMPISLRNPLAVAGKITT